MMNMPRFMKKNGIGLMVEAPDGERDFDVTEVRMTKLEYVELNAKIDTANNENRRIKYEAEKKQESISREADRKLKAVEHNAEIEKRELLDQLQVQKNLNINLKRIAKERANAKRGLVKKEHSGYVVLNSGQYKQKNGRDVVSAWKTLLQTPFDASIPFHQAEEEIIEDLWQGGVLYDLGVRDAQSGNNNGEYKIWLETIENGKRREICGLYGWSFKANYRSGFWEMDLYHTKSIKVPEEYRPVVR